MNTRGRLINLESCLQRHWQYFFAYFICGIALPALWTIVTEAIYDVLESHIFPGNFETHFTTTSQWTFAFSFALDEKTSATDWNVIANANCFCPSQHNVIIPVQASFIHVIYVVQISCVVRFDAALLKLTRQGPNSIERKNKLENFTVKPLENQLSFPTLRKRSKIGSLDMSQKQNGISSGFSVKFFFYWIRPPKRISSE